MPKNIEDIIPSGRKSIRSIPVPIRKERLKESSVREESAPASRLSRLEEEVPRVRKGKSRKGLFVGGTIAVLLLAFAVLALQRGATLAYTPKVSKIAFANDSYSAYQTPADGQLPFSVIKLSGERSTTVPATGEENATERASGRVVIFNEQSTSQQLVRTTRLETADGKIYRIQEDITIPAKSNVEVTAVADQVGPTYNIPLSDFTIPGFKGTPRYELVYARSRTPMAGGFSGMRKKVSESDLAKAQSSMEGSLRTELLGQARAQMPTDFILFPELASVTYEVLPVEGAGENSAKVTIRGNLSAAIFKRNDLSQYLAAQKIGAENLESEVIIDNFSTLDVTTTEGEVGNSGILRIQIAGTADARHITDEVALASDLVGVPKDSIDTALKRYPSIKEATAVVKPFWKSSFPNDLSAIKIERR